MTRTGLKAWLESLYSRFNDTAWIASDPVEFPHAVENNREFVAFTAAVFAYGRVASIKSFLAAFFRDVGTDPRAMNTVPDGLVYRFQNTADIGAYVSVMGDVYREFGSIENLFKSLDPDDLQNALVRFRGAMIDRGRAYGAGRGYSHLFADPAASAAKRLHMFLRWMIRRDAVDFGIWSQYNKSELLYPLDTHITRFAVAAGMLTSGGANAAASRKVTEAFAEIAPDDPVKYDFALARLGISHACAYGHSSKCELCTLNGECFLIDKCEKTNIVNPISKEES